MNFSLAGSNFKDVITYIREIIWILIPILSGVAFIVFFWGLSKFILNSNKPEEIKNGRDYMIWGILALFVLITFRTIIGLVSSDLEIGAKKPNEYRVLLKTDAVTPSTGVGSGSSGFTR